MPTTGNIWAAAGIAALATTTAATLLTTAAAPAEQSAAETPVAAQRPAARDTNRPNIVMIMTDDQRADELGERWMTRTRQLIAQQGVEFRQSYAPTAVCAPARASFLTGKYAHNHGVLGVSEPFGYESFRDGNTLPVWLRQAGYRTIHLGKYINGYGDGSTNGEPDKRYVPPGWTDWRASLDPKTYNYFDTMLADNGKWQTTSLNGRYQTNAYGRIGSDLIERYSGRNRPFFLNIAFTAPHHGGPREADDLPGTRSPARSPQSIGNFDRETSRLPDPDGEPGNRGKPWPVSGRDELDRIHKKRARNLYRQRAEAESTVDVQVKRLIETLRREGELEETYVLFTSDNGYLLGEARHVQGKNLPYQPSASTPLAIRGPGIPHGQVRNDPFTSVDFAPTIADMANVTLRPQIRKRIDGRSMLRIAKRGDRGWKYPIVTSTGALKGDQRVFGKGIRTPRFLYTEYVQRGGQQRRELYALKRDPNELRNVIGQERYRSTQRRLARILHRRDDCVGVECRKPG